MIQDDDKIVLDRWSQQYKEIKEGTIAEVVRMISSTTLHSFNTPISHLYFYFLTKDSEILDNLEKPILPLNLSYIQIDIPIKYIEKLKSMNSKHIDIDLISEIVDVCIQKLLTRLNTTEKYSFFDMVVLTPTPISNN